MLLAGGRTRALPAASGGVSYSVWSGGSCRVMRAWLARSTSS